MRALYLYTHGFPAEHGRSSAARLSWLQLQVLARRGKVDLLALVPLSETEREPSAALRSLCRRIEAAPAPTSRSEAVGSALAGLVNRMPPAFTLKLSARAEAFLSEAFRTRAYDLLVTHSPFGLANLRLADYRAAGYRPPLLLVAEEVQWSAWRGYSPWQWRAIGAQQALQSLLWRRMRRFERFYGRLARLVLCLSPREQQAMLDLDPAIRTGLIPLTTDTRLMTPQPAPEESRRILFTGNFSHPPNRLAAIELVRRVLPLVRQSVPEANLLLAGRDAASLKSLAGPAVELADNVPSLVPLYHAAAVMAGPIRTGEGVRGKFLEALACACPVVTTPLGASGIQVTPEEGLLVFEKPAGMAGSIVRLLQYPALRRRLGESAAQAVRKAHDTAAFERAFESHLDALLAKPEGAP